MDVEECQFMWIINNFDVVKAKVQNLQEQLVILDGKAGETWHLELIPDLADKRCFHVRCTLVKKSVPDVSSICAIWSLQIQFSDTETFFRQRLGDSLTWFVIIIKFHISQNHEELLELEYFLK